MYWSTTDIIFLYIETPPKHPNIETNMIYFKKKIPKRLQHYMKNEETQAPNSSAIL